MHICVKLSIQTWGLTKPLKPFHIHCHGLNLVSSKFIGWSPGPQHLRVRMFGDRVLKEVIKIKSLGWALIQCNCYLYKPRLGNRHTGKTEREKGPLQTKERGLRRNWPCYFLDVGFLASRILRMNFCCLSYPVTVMQYGNPSKLIQTPSQEPIQEPVICLPNCQSLLPFTYTSGHFYYAIPLNLSGS